MEENMTKLNQTPNITGAFKNNQKPSSNVLKFICAGIFVALVLLIGLIRLHIKEHHNVQQKAPIEVIKDTIKNK